MVCGSGVAHLRCPRRLFVLCVLAAGEPGGGGIMRCRGRMRRRVRGSAKEGGRGGYAGGCGVGCAAQKIRDSGTGIGGRGVCVRSQVILRPVGETSDICDQIEPLISRKFGIVIFRIIPFPIFSPGCIGIRVVRPSGCRMNRWLPFCLICRKPMFSNALITFLAGRGLIVSIKQKPQLVGCQ